MIVELTADEIAWALRNAEQRHQWAYEFSYKENGGTNRANSLGHHTMGALGEVACEKLWGVPHRLTTRGDRNEGDVLGRFVRTTKSFGGIPVRPDEQEHLANEVLVLVWDRRPLMDVIGWAYGHEVTQEKFWRADWPAPAWCLPWQFAKPLEAIPVAVTR